jgi:diaminohydroxyphosphoribosylaminopyrimidine deaminase / 5-amino-6-(5-phosphoribosylamino)uracil reductase
MKRALELAARSAGVASPNPAVGCVLVKDGRVVGEGLHEYDRKDHAEVAALKQAGAEARGAIAYVTLEPCCTTGRTGPCTEALIRAKVARVVVATEDPNPAVHGEGLARLRNAGIAAEAGIGRTEAQALNDGFARFIRTALPFVTLKAAMSLDGRIAPAPGAARRGAPVFLTGEAAREQVQTMRHGADAVITGINTVLEDDPMLTDRTGLPRRRPLLRVVLDSGLRIPMDSKLVRSAQGDLLILCAVAPTQRQRTLEALGVRVERVACAEAGGDGAGRSKGARPSGVSLNAVLRRLGEMEILSAMLEAGGQVNSAALGGDHVDKLTLFYAPVFLGASAVPLLREPMTGPAWRGVPAIAHVGQDVRVDAYLRNPWEES